jgi:hypothetical protein
MERDNLQSIQNSALQILAYETKTPTDEVVRIYESERAKLAAGARIQTFIPALALRRARARLHRRLHLNAAR